MTIIFMLLDAMLFVGFTLAALFGGAFLSNRRFPLPDALAGKDRPIRVGLGVDLWREDDGKSGKVE
jgi:hypothetical protein